MVKAFAPEKVRLTVSLPLPAAMKDESEPDRMTAVMSRLSLPLIVDLLMVLAAPAITSMVSLPLPPRMIAALKERLR